jgi:hypothetical protein
MSSAHMHISVMNPPMQDGLQDSSSLLVHHRGCSKEATSCRAVGVAIAATNTKDAHKLHKELSDALVSDKDAIVFTFANGMMLDFTLGG